MNSETRKPSITKTPSDSTQILFSFTICNNQNNPPIAGNITIKKRREFISHRLIIFHYMPSPTNQTIVNCLNNTLLSPVKSLSRHKTPFLARFYIRQIFIQGKKKSVPTIKGNALKTILENETTQTVHPLIEGFDLGCYW